MNASHSYAVDPGACRFARVGAWCAAGAALLAAVLLRPSDAGAGGATLALPLAIPLLLLLYAAWSVRWARASERYRFTVGPEGFGETPRHAAGVVIPWSRVAHLVSRPYGPRLELRAADGQLVGALELAVTDLARAFDAILAHVPQQPAPLPATYRWRTPWLLLLVVGSAVAYFVGLGLDVWLGHGDPAGIALIVAFLGFALLTATVVRWRTIIEHDRVVVWRGLRREEIPWRDVHAVSLVAEARSIDVAVRRSSGVSVCIRPTDGDLLGVLVTARAAHAAALSGASPPPHAAAARTP